MITIEEDKYLLEKLIAVLSKHCGETGLNEGALETLQRLSEIVNRLNQWLEDYDKPIFFSDLPNHMSYVDDMKKIRDGK